MGEYLLLQWLSTRRGLIVFLLLFLMTAFSSVCRLGSTKSQDSRSLAKGNHNQTASIHKSKK